MTPLARIVPWTLTSAILLLAASFTAPVSGGELPGRASSASSRRSVESEATGDLSQPEDPAPPATVASPIRALVITGGHDHETSFYSLFEGSKDLGRVPVSSSSMAFQNRLVGKYDVIVMYDFSRDLDEKGRENLREYVEQGGGVVVLHHALLDYQDWKWWVEDAVGGSYRLTRNGDQPSSTVKDRQTMSVTPVAKHPITSGIQPFQVVDESYKRMWFSPEITPLLSTDEPSSDRNLAWIGPTAAYRVVAVQLGHGPEIFGHPSYRKLVHNTIRWAAGRLN